VGSAHFDATIIGGGFYGCEIALELKRLGFDRVLILERNAAIMRRASYVNQARIHNGYHYPRSLSTAESSHENFERFVSDYAPAVSQDMEKIYAIAYGSRVNANQYERFCKNVGIPCMEVSSKQQRLFDSNLIEAAFQTKELVFNTQVLAQLLVRRLSDAQVELRFEAKVTNVEAMKECIGVSVAGDGQLLQTDFLFNCTYASLDQIGIPLQTRIKRELTEMILIDPPKELKKLGITVMDGPFFSTMPFPSTNYHTLSHVRYTPHESWIESEHATPEPRRTNRDMMMRDASRYLPILGRSRIVRSIFELKAILAKTEDNDARPILFEQSQLSPRIFSIMGSKLDNIYDIQTKLKGQLWTH